MQQFIWTMVLVFVVCGITISQNNEIIRFVSSSKQEVISEYNTTTAAINNQMHQPRPRRRTKLADGCYHVFLDVGSNIGMHTRFLYEPQKYPQATIARKVFEKHFGLESTRDNRAFCSFSFEPNPRHVARHEEMRQAYAAMGWMYNPIHAGASDTNGNLTFYNVEDETGYTMLKSSCRKQCDAEMVPVIRLSDWIDREIRGRRLPLNNTYHERGPPRVVMKMDVEMMEWLIFPDLLDTGVLCHDTHGVMIEFHMRSHWFLYPITFAHSRMGDNYTINQWQDAKKLKDEYMIRMIRDPNCKLDLQLQDDESHRSDGVPWPNPNSGTANVTLPSV